MFAKRTTFVIGAGASSEIGLPVGSVLASKISDKLNIRYSNGFSPDPTGDHQLLNIFKTEERILEKFWLVRDGLILSNSIDNYLDNHRHDAVLAAVGKAAIYKSIREYENSSILTGEATHSGVELDFSALSKTWYVKLFRMLQDGVSYQDVDSIFRSVTFVVFNYDRCLERFLYNALIRAYGISGDRAQGVVNSCNIIHVYGRVGRLPWQKEIYDGEPVEAFGDSVSQDSLRKSNDAIQTYTEQLKTHVARDVSAAMDASEKVIFLGFAYASQNMSLLGRSELADSVEIVGTAKGSSVFDAMAIQSRISGLYRTTTVQIDNNHTCAELFDSKRELILN